jgi:chromate transporter
MGESRASVWDVTKLFFRVGNTTFGGGYITIAALGRELVDLKGWISQEDFALAFAVARIAPGTNLIAFCAAAGARVCGVAGAFAATLALTAPSAVPAVLLMQSFETWRNQPMVMAAVAGTVAAVSGMMWSTIWTMVRPHLNRLDTSMKVVVITGGSFLASYLWDVPPVPILAAAIAIGLLWRDGAEQEAA